MGPVLVEHEPAEGWMGSFELVRILGERSAVAFGTDTGGGNLGCSTGHLPLRRARCRKAGKQEKQCNFGSQAYCLGVQFYAMHSD